MRTAPPTPLSAGASPLTCAVTPVARARRPFARHLALLLGLGAAGCSTIGHEWVAPRPRADAPAGAERTAAAAPASPVGPVMMVVVEGLRRDVLASYLESLADFDQVPPWPSGLSLLAEDGFRFARGDRVEATVPGVGFGPLAALATGHFAGHSGVPASRFHHADASGRLRAYDFGDAHDAAQIFFGPNFTRPTPETPPALVAALAVPTLAGRAAAQRQVLAAFDPFGHGAHWLVPDTSGAGVNALLLHRVGAAAAPIFDRGARDAAQAAVHRHPDLDLLTLHFRAVEAESCLESVRRCQTGAPVATVQRDALQRLDGHLWRVLRGLRGARPDRFKNLTLLLVSAGGVADLDPAEALSMSAEALVAHLEAEAGRDCEGVLTAHLAAGDLVVDGDSAAGLVSLRGVPAGQRQVLSAPRRCLAAGLAASLDQVEGPLAAAGWRAPDGTVRSRIVSREGERVPGARAPRVAARFERALSGPMGASRTGEAVVILRQPLVFDPPGRVRHGRRGGLEPGATEAAFLLASRHLTDEAVAALRSQAVELVDVAPTVLQLLQVPATDLPRPSLLSRDQAGRLVPMLADRSAQVAEAKVNGLFFEETDEALVFGLSEPAGIWPPDEFAARVGDAREVWDGDAGRFGTDSPCAYREDTVQRRWTCTVQRSALGPGRHLLALRRAPAPDDDAPDDSAQEGHWVAVIGAPAAPAARPTSDAPAEAAQPAAGAATSPPATSTPAAEPRAPVAEAPVAEAPAPEAQAPEAPAPKAAALEAPTPEAPVASAPDPGSSVAFAAAEGAPNLAQVELVCAAPDHLRLRLTATDPLGLTRVTVFVADGTGAGRPGQIRALAAVDQGLEARPGGLAAACSAGITAPECTLSAAPTTLTEVLTVPVPATLLEHGDRAARLPAAEPADRESLLNLYLALGGSPPPAETPRRAFLAVALCNVAGRCIHRALATDLAWRSRLAEGCP